jgi:hypothetical protein
MGERSRIQWTDSTWNPVPGFKGYWIFRDGRIQGPRRKILKPLKKPTGHLYVVTGPRNARRNLMVHRAILLAFRGVPRKGQEARPRAILRLRGHSSSRIVANEFGVSHSVVQRIWRGEIWANVQK